MNEIVNPAPVLVMLLVALVAGLLASTALRRREFVVHTRWSHVRGGNAQWTLVALGTLAASWPLLGGFSELVSEQSMLPGDAPSHALVAERIATHGLSHGWIDAYAGGFPFGPHYQSAALLVIAVLVEVGIPPASATQGVGLVSVLVLPFGFVLAARALGARPLAALLGALLLSWADPFQTYIGGPRPYLSQGVVSQVFAIPWLLALGFGVLQGGRWRPWAPLIGAVCAASHAQLTVCALAAAAPVALVALERPTRRRFIEAGLGVAIAGAALYGPGLRSFAVPFGWLRVSTVKVVGWGPERLGRWLLDGELFDATRLPILTGLFLVAVLALATLARSRVPRAALALVVATLLGSVIGAPLYELGGVAQRLAEVFSPVRMLCLVPVAAAIALTVAATEASERFAQLLSSAGAPRLVCDHALEASLVALVTATTGASMLPWLSRRVAVEATLRELDCGRDGYRTSEVRGWLRDLDRGRFTVDEPSFGGHCPVLRGVELGTGLVYGATFGGPGTQLGTLHVAFEDLRVGAPGGATRAEALGVRYVLHTASHPPAPEDGWRAIRTEGETQLSERTEGTDLVGVGCVTERWTGSNRSLRTALFADFARPLPRSMAPRTFVELVVDEQEPVAEENVASVDCDASTATVAERSREPGAYEATVESARPVDVVIRATYVPTWTVLVDGQVVPYRRVAPGFLAVRVGPGRHRLEATVAPPGGHLYLATIAAAFAVATGIGWASALRDRSARARTPR